MLTLDQFNSMNMAWGNMDSSQFSDEITVQGAVRVPVENMQEVTTFYGGLCKWDGIARRPACKKGEYYFYLENPEFILLATKLISRQKSQLNYLKSEYDRQRRFMEKRLLLKKIIWKQRLITKAQEQRQKVWNVNWDCFESMQMSSSLNQIRSKVPIYSPIAGFVTAINVVPGAFMQPRDVAVSFDQ